MHWVGLYTAKASWEREDILWCNFPSLVFEDKHISKAGSDVMSLTAAKQAKQQIHVCQRRPKTKD